MSSLPAVSISSPRDAMTRAGQLLQLLLGYVLLSAIPVAGREKSGGHDHSPENSRAPTADEAPRGIDEPGSAQHARSRESGRGRDADGPREIPLPGWKAILWRTYRQVGEDRLLAVAAGVVFYGLLALFPTITALVSIYGLFTDPSTISGHLSLATGFLPSGGVEILDQQAKRIASKSDGKLGLAFLFGLGLALWSANAGMKAVIDALNVIYDETEKRGFVKLNLLSLALTAGGIMAILLAIGAIVLLPLVLSFVGLDGMSELLLRSLRWPALLVMVIFGLAALYRFGPSRDQARWHWLSVGSVLAAIAWLASSFLFSWYLEKFADYDATYGSLGAAIGLMMWMWLSAILILLGAELNSEIERQTARVGPVGARQPIGRRGKAVADSVAAAQ